MFLRLAGKLFQKWHPAWAKVLAPDEPTLEIE